MKKAAGSVFAALLVLTIWVAPAAASTKSQLRAKALSLSNFPTGWSVDKSASSGGASVGGCLAGVKTLRQRGDIKVSVAYHDGAAPALHESLEEGPGAKRVYRTFNRIFSACKHLSVTAGGSTIQGTVGAMSFPAVGTGSSAYAANFETQGINLWVDSVIFQASPSIVGLVALEGLGQPDPSSLQAYVTEAVNKVEGKPTTTPTTF
jgi:hypothetical protein